MAKASAARQELSTSPIATPPLDNDESSPCTSIAAAPASVPSSATAIDKDNVEDEQLNVPSTSGRRTRRILSSDDESDGVSDNERQRELIQSNDGADSDAGSDESATGVRRLRRQKAPLLGMPLSMVYIQDDAPRKRRKKRRRRNYDSDYVDRPRRRRRAQTALTDLPELEPIVNDNSHNEEEEDESVIVASTSATEAKKAPRALMSKMFANLVATTTASTIDSSSKSANTGSAALAPPTTVSNNDDNSARAFIEKATQGLASRFGLDTDEDTPPPLICAEPDKRKSNRVRHDMLTKMKAVELCKTHSVRQTAELLGIDHKCVRRWKEQEMDIRQAIVRGDANATRVRLQNGGLSMHAKLEFHLLSWILSSTADGYAPTRPEIQNQALLIRNELLPSPGQRLFNFKAGDSWVSRFIEKHKSSLGPWLNIRGLNYTPRQPKDKLVAVIHETALKAKFVPKPAPNAVGSQASTQTTTKTAQQITPAISKTAGRTVSVSGKKTSKKSSENKATATKATIATNSNLTLVQQLQHAPTMVTNTLQQQINYSQALTNVPLYTSTGNAFVQQQAPSAVHPYNPDLNAQATVTALIGLPTGTVASYDLGVPVSVNNQHTYDPRPWY